MEPGTELDGGRYRIVRPLAQGGMGSVFEAINTRTGRHVAIKLLLPSAAPSQPEAMARLTHEAEASCRVQHRHVVDIYDIGGDGSSFFLVMQYLEGETLSALLRCGGVSMGRLISLLLPAMHAVSAAHRLGIVHRDIKPDNIFIAKEAEDMELVPKVLDFGVSKLNFKDSTEAEWPGTGVPVGTPRYMSHEQLLGVSDLDGRADIYSFGVLLYEALVGFGPYEARSHSDWLACFTSPPIRPKFYRPSVPSSLDALVMRCLARDRDERFPTMDALIQELTRLSQHRAVRNLQTAGRISTERSSACHLAVGSPESVPAPKLSTSESCATPDGQDFAAGTALRVCASAPSAHRSIDVPSVVRVRRYLWTTWVGFALLFVLLFVSWGPFAEATTHATQAEHTVLPAPLTPIPPEFVASQQRMPAPFDPEQHVQTGFAEPRSAK